MGSGRWEVAGATKVPRAMDHGPLWHLTQNHMTQTHMTQTHMTPRAETDSGTVAE